ncbi:MULTISPECIES: TraX family protein [Pseudomonas]|uniref:Conjugal transfer protein TraX n=1 Tax=Pseudomonas frederiksbergensis TaxID=104087 RepID=A0A0B1ZB80_9PSED|nr:MULTISPECIES: TraX family protein [Pseudomonas]MDD2030837.1 conjugal transfer protein TraX [Pseudomonas sp. 39167]
MSLHKRDTNLDLIKWLAMLTMLLDHLRYVWPDTEWLFIVGRLAFPLFCLGVAANVARSQSGALYSEANARYLGWMAAFALISELPYRLLSSDSSTLNVMPSLLLGLLIAWGAHHRGRDGLVLALAGVTVAVLIQERLMYGVFGALLPAALLLAIQLPGLVWLLPAALCVLANSRNRWLAEWELQPYSLLIVSTAFFAPLLGLWLLSRPDRLRIWPVTRWGYWFYPGHLAALHLIRSFS